VDPTRVDAPDRVLTVPNVVSLVRLAGVPLFLYLFLVAHQEAAAVAVLAVGGTTDWVDGFLARRLGQESRLGALLDPFADRLYILAVLVGLALREVIPLWLAVLIPLRDVLLFGLILVLRRRGHGTLPVHFLGKAATFCLLYAFPLLFLGDGGGAFAAVAKVLGWAFAIWGTGLYWWAGVLYGFQASQLLRRTPPVQPVSEEGQLRR
jgi:cardiolipin synthase (CMP-forming)